MSRGRASAAARSSTGETERTRPLSRRAPYLVERLTAAEELRFCGWVRLLMPSVALREPFSKAFAAFSWNGPRLATTRIPYELVLSRGFVITSFYAVGADVLVPEPHKLIPEQGIDRLANTRRVPLGLVEDRLAGRRSRCQRRSAYDDPLTLVWQRPNQRNATHRTPATRVDVRVPLHHRAPGDGLHSDPLRIPVQRYARHRRHIDVNPIRGAPQRHLTPIVIEPPESEAQDRS